MRITRRVAVTIAAAALALALGAAKPAPAPTPSPFIPEVAYRYVGNSGQDLRLSNAAGSAAVLLHRSTGYLSAFDLARPSARSAVLVESTGLPSDRLVLRTWTQDAATGALTVAPAQTLYESRSLFYPDFSPDGTKVSFVEWEGPAGFYSLRVIDLATGALQTVASGVRDPYFLRWSSTGESLYYANPQPGSGAASVAYRQPVSGGTPIAMFSRPNIERWDISRDGSDSLILNYSSPETGQTIPFAIWDGASLSNVYPQLIGVAPHYACGNTRMIYLSYGKGGARGPLKVFTPASGTDVIYSRDQSVVSADWMPCD